MSSEQDQEAIKAALRQLLEPDAAGDVQASIAISLKKISDKLLAETPAKAPIVIRK
jgi:hypothetical protein